MWGMAVCLLWQTPEEYPHQENRVLRQGYLQKVHIVPLLQRQASNLSTEGIAPLVHIVPLLQRQAYPRHRTPQKKRVLIAIYPVAVI